MKNKIISRALAMILAGTLVLLTPVTTYTVFAKENTTTTESVTTVSSDKDTDDDSNNMQIFLPLVIVLIAGLVFCIGDN